MADEQRSLFPTGLTRGLFDRLSRAVDEAAEQSPADLLRGTDEHLDRVRQVSERNRLVNYRLAQAIVESLRAILGDWEQVPRSARPWLLGAAHYFIGDDDEESDFTSPIGFEDDAEVLNACLVFAGRDDLCLNTEDYDDV